MASLVRMVWRMAPDLRALLHAASTPGGQAASRQAASSPAASRQAAPRQAAPSSAASSSVASGFTASASPVSEQTPDGTAIRVVGPNPALDRIEILDRLRIDDVNRSIDVHNHAGGKSLNVARVLRRLGLDVTAYGFLGGWTGDFIRKACVADGIADRHTPIAGDTRISVILAEPRTGASTVVNEPGPVIAADEAATLSETVAADCRPGDLVVLSGSLPRGVPLDFGATLVRVAQDAGARAVVDTSGAALAAAIEARPWMLKPNLAELAHLTGRDLHPDRPAEIVGQMRSLIGKGIGSVVVTLGAAGALYADAHQTLRVRAPRVAAKNPTGAGDIMLAGFVAATSCGAGPAAALRIGVSAAAASVARVEPDIGGAAAVLALLDGATVETHPA